MYAGPSLVVLSIDDHTCDVLYCRGVGVDVKVLCVGCDPEAFVFGDDTDHGHVMWGEGKSLDLDPFPPLARDKVVDAEHLL